MALFDVLTDQRIVAGGNDNIAHNSVHNLQFNNSRVKEGDLMIIYGANLSASYTANFSGFAKGHLTDSFKNAHRSFFFYKSLTANDISNGYARTTFTTSSGGHGTLYAAFMIIEGAQLDAVKSLPFESFQSGYDYLDFNYAKPFMSLVSIPYHASTGFLESDNFIAPNYMKIGNQSALGMIYGKKYMSGFVGTDAVPSTRNRWSTSDGAPIYHYQLVEINQPPTTPGTFTQPAGTLEIGDSKVISWGASVDAQNNLSKYILEASINGGAYSVIGQPTSPSFTYTIPTATSITFRVKAVDSGGLESGYRASSTFTVAKPMYYWSKYNSVSTPIYSDSSQWTYSQTASWTVDARWRNWGFDKVANRYYIVGNPIGITNVNPGEEFFEVSTGAFQGHYVYKYVILSGNAPNSPSNTRMQIAQYSKSYYQNNVTSTEYSRGTLAESGIVAEENTYPNDVRHTDGYWYIRGSRVSQTFTPPEGFTAPAIGSVFKPDDVVRVSFSWSARENQNGNLSLFEVDYRYNNGAWTSLGYYNNANRDLTITTDTESISVEFRVRAKNTNNVYSDYIYSEKFTIKHNKVPTLSLTDSYDQPVVQDQSIKHIKIAPFTFSILAQDEDIGDNLEYGVWLRNTEYKSWEAIQNGEVIEISIPSEDMLTGNNTIEVKVRDNNGGEESITFVIRNLAPESYSQKHVYELIMDYM